MTTLRSLLRNEINARLLPALHARGFSGATALSGNGLSFEFRKVTPSGCEVLTIQLEKSCLPRFIISLYVAPPGGVVSLIEQGGTLITGLLQPGKGTSTRYWFRADPTWWQKLRFPGRTFEREAVDGCLELLAEMDQWWQTRQASEHIRLLQVNYPGTASATAMMRVLKASKASEVKGSSAVWRIQGNDHHADSLRTTLLGVAAGFHTVYVHYDDPPPIGTSLQGAKSVGPGIWMIPKHASSTDLAAWLYMGNWQMYASKAPLPALVDLARCDDAGVSGFVRDSGVSFIIDAFHDNTLWTIGLHLADS